MKILLIVSSMHAGGAERVASTLVNAWAERGDEVTLLITYSGRGDCVYSIHPSVELVWLADQRSNSRWIPAVMKRWLTLRRLIKQAEPDVIISFLTNVNVATLMATRGLDLPLIVCERTNPSLVNNVGPVLDFLRKITYRFATRVNVQSEQTVQGLTAMVPALNCIDVIPNPLPVELMNYSGYLESVSEDPAQKRIVAMGRLSNDKQFDVLISIFSKLARAYPDWQLTIWGDGPQRAALEAQIEALGLAAQVSLPGRTTQAWLELARGQIFAMTSRVEGFPNVLLEALSLGLPCVTYDCQSGPAELSEAGQSARLISLGDEAGFLEALTHLMDDAQARADLGRRGASSVKRRYAVSKIIGHWDAVFDRIKRGDVRSYRA